MYEILSLLSWTPTFHVTASVLHPYYPLIPIAIFSNGDYLALSKLAINAFLTLFRKQIYH
jgi:hypothetical protein